MRLFQKLYNNIILFNILFFSTQKQSRIEIKLYSIYRIIIFWRKKLNTALNITKLIHSKTAVWKHLLHIKTDFSSRYAGNEYCDRSTSYCENRGSMQ